MKFHVFAPKQMMWQIDKQKGVGTLAPVDYKGPRFELPLRPMLGCIGTRAALRSAEYPDRRCREREANPSIRCCGSFRDAADGRQACRRVPRLRHRKVPFED